MCCNPCCRSGCPTVPNCQCQWFGCRIRCSQSSLGADPERAARPQRGIPLSQIRDIPPVMCGTPEHVLSPGARAGGCAQGLLQPLGAVHPVWPAAPLDAPRCVFVSVSALITSALLRSAYQLRHPHQALTAVPPEASSKVPASLALPWPVPHLLGVSALHGPVRFLPPVLATAHATLLCRQQPLCELVQALILGRPFLLLAVQQRCVCAHPMSDKLHGCVRVPEIAVPPSSGVAWILRSFEKVTPLAVRRQFQVCCP
mmetsp:Transcript_40653/g.80326  ORF Transcript_40653/g.80326 Transcript_40653/m.80326 type:complete len:257 (-) Transcript_40653:895-1665(-)